MNYGIKMIDVRKIHVHPKNPRKNIGDVSELAESIKTNGIMQNLTVVPFESDVTGERCEGEYMAVIGHRRLAAAEAAGLTQVPCVIKEMSESEQLATMLAENIQRSELTPIEQAEGVQMMLDIGESVADISAKTGFSESTVRRRMKLLDLDREKLRETENRGVTLADYEKLNDIEDIKTRNKVLECIGTNNFNMQLQNALDEQKKMKNKKLLFAELDKFATKVTEYPSGYSWEESYNYMTFDGDFVPPKDAGETEYVYYPNSYSVALYKKNEEVKQTAAKKETKEEKIQREAREKENARIEAVKALAQRAYNLRKKFIDEFTPSPRHGKELKRFLWNMLCFCGGDWVDTDEIDKVFGTTLSEGGTYEETSSIADEYFEENSEMVILKLAYMMSNDCDTKYIYSWRGEWESDEGMDKLYECLGRLGYQMSDEEKKLQNGTHELFEKEQTI